MAIRPAGVLILLAGSVVLAACGESSPGFDGELFYGLACPSCIVEANPLADARVAALVAMGDVPVGVDVTRKITLINTGTLAIDIQETSADLKPFTTDIGCGHTCGARQLPVGGRLDVGFTLHATTRGLVNKGVTFRTSAGPVHVHLTGYALIPDIACFPAKLDFGALGMGSSLTETITCQNPFDRDAVVLTEPILEDRQFTDDEGPVTIGAHGSADIPVTFHALRLGPFSASIYVASADGSPLSTTLASGTVQDPLELDPPTPHYDFGFVRPGASRHMVVSVLNRGSKPLIITTLALHADHEFGVQLPARTPFQIPGGGDVQVGLTFAPPEGDVGARTGQLVITSDDPAGAVRYCDLAGFGGGPVLSCTWDGAPGALDFGEAAVGSTSTREITCTNVSPFDASHTQAGNLLVLRPYMNDSFSDYQASIFGDPLRRGYGAGQSFTIQVQYSPQSFVGNDDVVVLRSNDPDHPELDIPVTGVGVP